MSTPLETLLQAANERIAVRDLGSALKLYREALAAAPGNAAAGLGLAVALNLAAKPAEALALLQPIWAAVTAASPKPAPELQAAVMAQIAKAQEQLGKLNEALEAYRHAGRLVHSPELERRIKDLAPLVSSPPPVQQLILHARRQQASGQHREAGQTFKAALQLHPDSIEALHGLALVMRVLNVPAEAMTLLQKASMLAPDRADLYNDLGLVFQDRGDFGKAASFHNRAINVDPNFIHALINLGVAYKRLGRMEEAEAAYRRALKIDARSAQALNNLGNLLRAVGRLGEAKRHLQQAVALRADYADARGNLEAVLKAIKAQKKAPAKAKPVTPARTAVRVGAPAEAARITA